MFDSRCHLDEILKYALVWQGLRHIHFYDLFSGVGRAAREFGDRGYTTRTFDIQDDQDNDLTCKVGFFRALEVVLSLVEGAMILLGPPCSLWIFISRSYHRHSQESPLGDVSKAAVASANCLVRNVTLLLVIAHWRKVFFVLEQPGSSAMQYFPWVSILIEELRLQRIWTWMRAFGHMIPKPSYLLSNMQEAYSLRKVWSKKRSFLRKVSWRTFFGKVHVMASHVALQSQQPILPNTLEGSEK